MNLLSQLTRNVWLSWPQGTYKGTSDHNCPLRAAAAVKNLSVHEIDRVQNQGCKSSSSMACVSYMRK